MWKSRGNPEFTVNNLLKVLNSLSMIRLAQQLCECFLLTATNNHFLKSLSLFLATALADVNSEALIQEVPFL